MVIIYSDNPLYKDYLIQLNSQVKFEIIAKVEYILTIAA